MTNLLMAVHPWLGYAVTVAMLVVAVMMFGRVRDGREFRAAPGVAALVALDVQVLLGIVLYVLTQGWDSRPEMAYIHPLIAVAALGVGHAALRRARGQQMAADANRAVGRGLLVALLLVAASIGVASAPPFL